jgi:hypothetical protein
VAQDLETLFARAQAATLRAKRLEENISASRRRLIELIAARRMQRFMPAGRKISYPQDIPEKHHVYKPFPVQADKTGRTPNGPAEGFP